MLNQKIFEEIKTMSSQLQATINEANWLEANNEVTNHSFRKIIADKRRPAIAARMISHPIKLMKYSYDVYGNCKQHGIDTYDAQKIVDIIVNSVKNNNSVMYPLTGDWSKICVKQLYLFIKGTPVARFKVKEILVSYGLSDEELCKYTDPTPIKNSVYKSVAHITDVETSELPNDFLGNYSGKPISESALKGSRPLIYIL